MLCQHTGALHPVPVRMWHSRIKAGHDINLNRNRRTCRWAVSVWNAEVWAGTQGKTSLGQCQNVFMPQKTWTTCIRCLRGSPSNLFPVTSASLTSAHEKQGPPATLPQRRKPLASAQHCKLPLQQCGLQCKHYYGLQELSVMSTCNIASAEHVNCTPGRTGLDRL